MRTSPIPSSAAAKRTDAVDTRSDLLLLIDSVTDYAIFLLDPGGRIASWSAGAARIKGWRADEIIGRHFSTFYPPEDVAAGKPERELREAAEVGRFEDEGWRVRKDGSRFWASVIITALRGPGGELRGFGKVTRDLTERWLGKRLEGVLQSLSAAVLLRDRAGRVVWANERTASMAGCASSAELVARGAWDSGQEFSDESGRLLATDELPGRRALAGRDSVPAPSMVRVRNRASGRMWWAAVHARSIEDSVGGLQIVVSVWRDVTEERRHEEAERFLSRATAVLGESLDYAATMSRIARLLVPELADWCAVDVVEGGQLRNLAVEHVDPRKTSLARELIARRTAVQLEGPSGIGAVVRTGRAELTPRITDEVLVQRFSRDQDLLERLRELGLCSAMTVPLKSGDRTLGAMTLITAESGRVYEARDLALAEELGRRAGTAIDNAHAYAGAREAIRLRDEFLSIAGHELRTPLTALQLQLQSVDAAFARGQVANDPARWAVRVHKTVSHAHRLQKLIDELLDVSRITSGRLALERQDMDLADLWREVIERYALEAGRVGSVVTFEAQGSTAGRWDRARIDQVCTNLLSNAIKYGAGKPVRVSARGDGATVRTTVSDEGIGIDPAAQARMFGRFERAVSERHYGGFGLGLWIVRELVEAHGGLVGFESEPGRGSTFWVELPARADDD